MEDRGDAESRRRRTRRTGPGWREYWNPSEGRADAAPALTVLLLNCDETVALFLAVSLQFEAMEFGLEVSVVHTNHGQVVVDLLHRGEMPIDLVAVEWGPSVVPPIGCDTACSALERYAKVAGEVPVVVLTTWRATETHIERAQEIGVRRMVLLPFGFDLAEQLLHDMLTTRDTRTVRDEIARRQPLSSDIGADT